MSTAVVGKASGFAAYVILGWLLVPEDWGLYALVLGVSAFVQFLREAGIGPVLIHKGVKGFADYSGPAFWVALAFNGAAALALVLASSRISAYLGQPELEVLLWMLALVIIMGTPATLYSAKLQIDLRFRELSLIALCASVVRAIVVVALALAGAGAAALVAGQIAVTATAVIVGYSMTRLALWNNPIGVRHWPRMLVDSGWVMVGNLTSGLAQRGDYIVFGLFVSVVVLGEYTFANELVALSTSLVAGSAGAVLLPALTRVDPERRRFGLALARGIRNLMLATVGPSLLLALAIRPFELLAWQGKWTQAVPAVQAFAIAIPFQVLASVVLASMLAQGAFAKQAGIIALRGALIFVSAVAATYLAEEPAGFAATIALANGGFALLTTTVYLKRQECDFAEILRALCESWGPGLAGAAFAFVVDLALSDQDQAPVSRLLAITVSFLVTYVATARALLPNTLSEAISLLPPTASSLAKRLLLLD